MGDYDRREFLRVATAASLAAALPRCASALIRDSTHDPTPSDPLTEADAWYINSYAGTRFLDEASWRLRLEGLFARPRHLSLTDIRAFPRQSVSMTMMCVGNIPGGHLISSGEFSAVRLVDVLEDAGLDPAARALLVLGADGFPGLLEIPAARSPQTLLAYELGGSPLPAEHGYPVRLLRPGLFGYRQPKWIVAIRALLRAPSVRVVNHALDEIVGERIGVVSRIDRPFSLVPAGRHAISGLAFSGAGAIVRVEVWIDDGWRPARITYNTPDDVLPSSLWCLWALEADLAPGVHRLRVRAFDSEGRGQPEAFDFPYPSDAIHELEVTAT